MQSSTRLVHAQNASSKRPVTFWPCMLLFFAASSGGMAAKRVLPLAARLLGSPAALSGAAAAADLRATAGLALQSQRCFPDGALHRGNWLCGHCALHTSSPPSCSARDDEEDRRLGGCHAQHSQLRRHSTASEPAPGGASSVLGGEAVVTSLADGTALTPPPKARNIPTLRTVPTRRRSEGVTPQQSPRAPEADPGGKDRAVPRQGHVRL